MKIALEWHVNATLLPNPFVEGPEKAKIRWNSNTEYMWGETTHEVKSLPSCRHWAMTGVDIANQVRSWLDEEKIEAPYLPVRLSVL